jgi:translation initiation factor 2B subunit (eIF-2B alpha/beta/delta family)
MDDTTRRAIDRLRADAISGASELLPQAIAILRGARGAGSAPDEVAREVGHAQPSMASMWNAALAALAGAPALDRFEQRWRRSAAALGRVAADALRPAPGTVLHVVTCSFSGSVLACVRALDRAASRGAVTARPALRVSCAEGRPSLEGQRTAAALAAVGIAVDIWTDAAIGAALQRGAREEPIVLVGADAVAPGWMINKVGTAMLSAAASRAGVPVYVAATRDKFVDARVAQLLAVVEHEPAEVWDGPPAGVAVRNPYFERVGIDLVSGVLTDAGLLAADMIGEACRAASGGTTDADIGRLVKRPSSP